MHKQYGMLIDVKRCTGCGACIVACKQENDLPPSRDAVPGTIGFSFIRVETVGPEGEYPDLVISYRPIACMHCADPPCIPACPQEAIFKRKDDGIVLIDENECSGCESCIEACPYEAIKIDTERNIARKCTFCVNLVDQKSSPACVDACNGGALFFGDISDSDSEISRTIKANDRHCQQLKSEEETKPSNYYL